MSVSSPISRLGLHAPYLIWQSAEPEASLPVPSPSLGTRCANWAGAPRFFFATVLSDNLHMEITSFGDTCLRLRGKEGIVVADPFPRVVGPTGRGLTADIITYSHPDGQPTLGLDTPAATKRVDSVGSKGAAGKNGMRIPTSLESAFLLDSPGEYDVHTILVTGVRTYRDEKHGEERGFN